MAINETVKGIIQGIAIGMAGAAVIAAIANYTPANPDRVLEQNGKPYCSYVNPRDVSFKVEDRDKDFVKETYLIIDNENYRTQELRLKYKGNNPENDAYLVPIEIKEKQ